jgi:hypothetical protein
MNFTKRENSTELQKNIKRQIKSLFIGAVINDTSLYDYAITKELISHNAGYTTFELNVMQKHIDILKQTYPNLYNSFRIELLSQVQGRSISSIFNICDKYIRCFINLKFFDHKEFNGRFRNFSSRVIV